VVDPREGHEDRLQGLSGLVGRMIQLPSKEPVQRGERLSRSLRVQENLVLREPLPQSLEGLLPDGV